MSLRNRLASYGLDADTYFQLKNYQNGLCALCRESLSDDPKGEAIDHDHATGKVRGLLCRNCNTLLGRMGDSVDKAEITWNRVKRYLTTNSEATESVLNSRKILQNIKVLQTEWSTARTWTARVAKELKISLFVQDNREYAEALAYYYSKEYNETIAGVIRGEVIKNGVVSKSGWKAKKAQQVLRQYYKAPEGASIDSYVSTLDKYGLPILNTEIYK